MIALDVLYVALATIGVMIALQIVTFAITRIMYPPEPRIIYRDVPVPVVERAPVLAPTITPASLPQQPAFTQPPQEIQLPEYEPRKPIAESLRMDVGIPDGIQETRPPGT